MGYPQEIIDSETKASTEEQKKEVKRRKLAWLMAEPWNDEETFLDALRLPETEQEKKAVYLKGFAKRVQQSVDLWSADKDELVQSTAKNFYSERSNQIKVFEEIKTRYGSTQALALATGAGGLLKANKALYNELLNPKGDPQVVNLAAFRDFLEKNSQSEIRNVTDLEQAATDNKRALLDVLQASRGVTVDRDEELNSDQINTLKQCMLMTDLINEGWSYTEYTGSWAMGKEKKPYYGRIHPVTTAKWFDPDSFVNLLTISNKSKDYFLDEENPLGKTNLYHRLSWVYMDSDGKLKEAAIFADEQKTIEQAVTPAASAEALATAAGTNVDLTYINSQNKGKGFKLSNIDVKFEGTNPSTARDDVKVTLAFELDNIASLDAICSVAEITPSVNQQPAVKKYISLIDLVILPTIKTVEVKNVAGGNKFSNSQYSPDYSRIRLTLYTDSEQDDCLIVDLATINHEIKRKEDKSGKTEFTIEYRGYFEQALNMPFNNAFADDETIKIRLANEEVLNNLEKGKCSQELIRETVRANEEYTLIKAKQFLEGGGMIKKIAPFLYKATLQNANVYSAGLTIDPRINYIDKASILPIDADYKTKISGLTAKGGEREEKVIRENLFSNIGALDILKEIGPVSFLGPGGFAIKQYLDPEEIETKSLTQIEDQKQVTFFYIGDLLNVCLDSIYKEETNEHRKGMEQLNLQFIVGTMSIPIPKNFLGNKNQATNKFLTINPLQIPVELSFFLSWYHSNYVKKGIYFYPVGSFIRDLVEKLVNNLIYEVCFSAVLPDETPPQFRSTFFSDHGGEPFVSSETWFNPYSPTDGDMSKQSRTDLSRSLLTVRNPKSSVSKSRNFCVLYQSTPSYFRQLRAERNSSLKDEASTVTIFSGANRKNGNQATDVAFKKTSTPFLREARYFGSSFGSLSLMSNVYDLSFSFHKIMANTYFYPGNIINFILTDWYGPQEWSTNNSKDLDALLVGLGESNPHKKGTRANILGFGGYFLIKSVTYSIEPQFGPSFFKITLDCKFSGTDAIDSGNRDDKPDNKFATEKDECITIANTSIQRVNEALVNVEGAQFFDYVYNSQEAIEAAAKKEQEKANDVIIVEEEKVSEINPQSLPLEQQTVQVKPTPSEETTEAGEAVDPGPVEVHQNVLTYARTNLTGIAAGDPAITFPVSIVGAESEIKSFKLVRIGNEEYISYLDKNGTEKFKEKKP